MGSITMHLCASNEANKVLKLDLKRFLIGSIAPDIYKLSSNFSKNTHYIVSVNENGRSFELPDIDQFLKENYMNILNDDYYKGYYAHLIADKIWYKEFTIKYVDMLSEDKNEIKLIGHDEFIPYEKYRETIYQDYDCINNFLLKKYNIDTKLLYNIAILNMKTKDINDLLNLNIKNDINSVKPKTSLIDINDIYNWIEKSKNEIIFKISELRK